jgi:hypothetical protein
MRLEERRTVYVGDLFDHLFNYYSGLLHTWRGQSLGHNRGATKEGMAHLE